jgi:3-oxoadipyl-CoA thiolase
MLQDVFIVDACRTPIGRFGGTLAEVRPDDLLAHVIRQLLLRQPNLDPAAIEDVIAGAANQAGEDNRNVARMAALLADLPNTVPGVTVNRLCASGLQAVIDAARTIKAGEADVLVAGGVESMTRAPFVMGKAATAWSRNAEVYDTTMGWRFINPELSKRYHPFTMGETAENVAERYSITREDQDVFALESQKRCEAATQAGRFKKEIVPISIPQKKGEALVFAADEQPRPQTTLEALAKLAPAFKKGGSVTAGNSSGINDGAVSVLLVSGTALKKYNLTPLARVVGATAVGVDPAYMGIGPVPAIQKLLKRANLNIQDIDLIELNEAFAAQSLACVRELGLDPAKVNVNGGAIAIGHPLGCSGARLAGTLAIELQARQACYGIASLCVGVGQGVALLLERT